MFIQSINPTNNVSFKETYFTKSCCVLFNPHAKFMQEGTVVKSNFGYRYIEDSSISSTIKERFQAILKSLAENNDVFVWYTEKPSIKGLDRKPQNISLAKIIWSNPNAQQASEETINGSSSVSQEYATEDMFRKLAKRFCKK